MSYEPTRWAPQNPGQQPPSQSPVIPPPYGQPSTQPPALPTYDEPPRYPIPQMPMQPGFGPSGPPFQGAPTQSGPGQSNPTLPPSQGTPVQSGFRQSNPTLPPSQDGPAQPGFGQSNPALPPSQGAPAQPGFGQNGPASPAYPAPGMLGGPMQAAPYTQQQPPWGAPIPPAFTPPTPVKKKGWLKILILIIVVVVILAGGGSAALYLSTRPQPVISLSSGYHQNAALVGAISTTFQLTGHKFSANSAISVLLDGKSIPGSPAVQSDSNGNVTATLTVTNAWSVGNHTLTARDASGYLTKAGAQIMIVTPGQASTPGPNGAPTDSANMTVNAVVVAGASSGAYTLIVTGSANGGSVCRDIDNGKPHTQNGSSNGLSFTETSVRSCSGTYKNGKLTYTETVTSDKAVFSTGLICTAKVPYVNANIQGEFTSATSIAGTFSNDAVTFNCNLGVGSTTTPADQGNWTGVAVVQ